MSGVDVVARGLAVRAGAAARAAGENAGAPPIGTFAELAGSAVRGKAITAAGHTTAGTGAAGYVADARATEALLTAHPKAAFRAADGRIFRLSGDGSGGLTPEMFGAPGGRGVDSGPAIRAMFAYGAAVGIEHFTFQKPDYELWRPLRTSDFDTINAPDGHYIVLTANAVVRSARGHTRLHCVGDNGASGETTWQRIRQNATDPTLRVWRGNLLRIIGDPGGTPEWTISRIDWEGVDLLGDCLRDDEGGNWFNVNIDTAKGWDVSNKGVAIQDTGMGNLRFAHCTISGVKGETWYIGGFGPDSQLLEEVHLAGSNGSCFNPGGRFPVRYIGGSITNSWQAIEGFFGDYPGSLMSNIDVTDSEHSIIAGYGTWSAAQSTGKAYDYRKTFRNPAGQMPLVTLDNVRFRRCGTVQFTSNVAGRIELIDTNLFLNGEEPMFGGLGDIDLDIDLIADTGVPQVGLNGPATLTVPVIGGADGEYVKPARNINLRCRYRRSQLAIDTGVKPGPVITWGGHLEATTCRIQWESNGFTHPPTCSDATPKSFPLIEQTGAFVPIDYGGRPRGGWHFDYPGGVMAIRAPVAALWRPAGPMTEALMPHALGGDGLGRFGYVEGQLITIVMNCASPVIFRKNGSGLQLSRDRVLRNPHDFLVLRFSRIHNAWQDVDFFCSTADEVRTRQTLSLAAAAADEVQSVTLTQTGARPGDEVSLTVQGSRAKRILSAHVSANDIITIEAFNAGSASAPAATLDCIVTSRRAPD